MLTTLTLALVLAALTGPGDDPPLVPEAPAGWRSERLEFPLTFAPDIELQGYEELRFGPGMFDAGSHTYWSYLFGLHLEGQLAVDAPFLKSFLERYYSGLAEATRGEREVDSSTIVAEVEVEPDGSRFLATLRTVDTFVTGEPLTLRLVIDVHHVPGATELLALVSPQPEEHDTWSQLRDMGQAWRAARPPAAYLNHLFLIPDAETYAAIIGSEFLTSSFGVFEERTTVRADATYTGAYLYGQHTYFEFLRPDPTAGFGTGGTGLAFGFEVRGATQIHAARLADEDIQTFAGPRSRELDGVQLPWFEILGIGLATTTSRLNLFTLEYEPLFLRRWHAELPPATGGISRAAVLRRYAAHLDQTAARTERPLGDVTEVRLALDAAERTRLLTICRSFGHTVPDDGRTASGDHSRRGVQGPGFRLVIKLSDEPGGITGFDVSLQHDVEARTLTLGRLVVELSGRKASFELTPPG